MLTYYEWKKIKDWVEWILDKGSFLVEGAVVLTLADFGILPPISDVIAWFVIKAIKWGVSWLLDLIPHEAMEGIAAHRGNLKMLQDMGAPTMPQIKQAAKSIPLVPLRIPARKELPTTQPIILNAVPIDAPIDERATPSPQPLIKPPFGTGINFARPELDYRNLERTDRELEKGYSMHRTAPYMYNGSPIVTNPPIGFNNFAEVFMRGRKMANP